MSIMELVFSPTGGTAKVADLISRHLGGYPDRIDLSDAKTDFAKCSIDERDLALIAMPSFGGRAPAIAIERLKQIRGNGAYCVLVCTYGNRAYEDTLVEMEDAAKSCGFHVFAAISAVAEHSIMPQYATGRPDASDEKQLADFAEQISAKIGATVSIPGNRPYKKSSSVGLVPKVAKDCEHCGQCVEQCPVEAIDLTSLAVDPEKCISCMRCVKHCPAKARKVNGALVSVAALTLKLACSVRKENELFL